MKYTSLIPMTCCLLPLAACTTAPESSGKPNIVLINCDDMGYGDLSCYGHPTIKTPNIDRLADEGQKWSCFYVGSPVSSPSRAALMTGRLGVRTGMYGDKLPVMAHDNPEGFPVEEHCMAELFKEAGYTTGCVGKWHMGHQPKHMPLNNGFDYFNGSPFANDMSKREQAKKGMDFPQEYLIYEQDKIIARDPEQYTLTQRFTNAAKKFIANNHDKPFFLYLAHPMPHVPIYASEAFQGRSARGTYGDVVEELDWSVGEIMNCLKEYKLDKNTLVIFTSDNGPALMCNEDGGSSGPLREGKNTQYEGGFRVPCIMWGSMVDPGLITDMGSAMDFLPTFAEMAGYEMPKDVVYDGVSLLNVIKDHTAQSPRQEFFYYKGSHLFAVRQGNFKIHYLDQDPMDFTGNITVLDKPELYDLGVDPEERFNVADQHPDIVEQLQALTKQHKESFKIAESIFDKRPDTVLDMVLTK